MWYPETTLVLGFQVNVTVCCEGGGVVELPPVPAKFIVSTEEVDEEEI
jgi:hypothetical protein